MSEQLFITSSRKKYRFPTVKGGEMTDEQLWGLDFMSDRDDVTTLDTVAKALNKQVKAFNEESFVAKKTIHAKDAENKLEIVKFVISTKQREAELANSRKELVAAKQETIDALKEKRTQELKSLSVEQLEAKIRELEALAGM